MYWLFNNTQKKHKICTPQEAARKEGYLSDFLMSFIYVFKRFIWAIEFRYYPFWNLYFLGSLFLVVPAFNIDVFLYSKIGMLGVIPTNIYMYKLYMLWHLAFAHLLWGLWEFRCEMKFRLDLRETIVENNMISSIGRKPRLLSYEMIDEFTKKLTFFKAHVTESGFKAAKGSFENDLGGNIEQIKDNLESHKIDIVYTTQKMSESFDFTNWNGFKNYKFPIGKTRSKFITAKLEDIPHFLVGGITKGGKSNFIRGLITVLYKNNPDAQFSLIDLKEGLEFQLFSNLRRAKVVTTSSDAIRVFENTNREMKERYERIKESGSVNIEIFNEKLRRQELKGENLDFKKMGRKIIVIDEAAQIFAYNGLTSVKEAETARRTVSRIAALGRACGIHLVIATQRPDARSVAMEIKANLRGRIAFQMSDIPSSMVILDSKRATDLPNIAGRAIYHNGSFIQEIQIPKFDVEVVKQVLSYDVQKKKKTPEFKNVGKESEIKATHGELV